MKSFDRQVRDHMGLGIVSSLNVAGVPTIMQHTTSTATTTTTSDDSTFVTSTDPSLPSITDYAQCQQSSNLLWVDDVGESSPLYTYQIQIGTLYLPFQSWFQCCVECAKMDGCVGDVYSFQTGFCMLFGAGSGTWRDDGSAFGSVWYKAHVAGVGPPNIFQFSNGIGGVTRFGGDLCDSPYSSNADFRQMYQCDS